MTIIDAQFAELQSTHPSATLTALPSGAFLIRIEGVPLRGWTADHTTVRFLAPIGYPHAKPDCFWADQGLRLAGTSALPQASSDDSPIPETDQKGLWFSWHAATWNPNRDTLQTFVRVIRERLRNCA